jgi:hypothetical protein
MLLIGDQADVLRALGCWLDEQDAREVQIGSQDHFLAVSWSSADASDHHRSCYEHELSTLRLEARRLRQEDRGPGSPPGTLAELLRTLGQELDQVGLALDAIVQEPRGFRVSGVAAGSYYSELYETETLCQRGAERRAQRGRADLAGPQDRFLASLPGLRVVTADREQLGVVAEIGHERFKVRTSSFTRDYWLPTSTVATVVPETELILSFPKRELAQHKRHQRAPSPERAPSSASVGPTRTNVGLGTEQPRGAWRVV